MVFPAEKVTVQPFGFPVTESVTRKKQSAIAMRIVYHTLHKNSYFTQKVHKYLIFIVCFHILCAKCKVLS